MINQRQNAVVHPHHLYTLCAGLYEGVATVGKSLRVYVNHTKMNGGQKSLAFFEIAQARSCSVTVTRAAYRVGGQWIGIY